MDEPLTGAQLKKFQTSLLAWFRRHRRELPWRASRDPYRIWIAEVMLQQTRIAAVIPYYERFLARFPDFQALASAPQPDVLKLWSGLGYYSRARNLHAAAKAVVAQHAGEFPRELDAALALPGIGVYTAAAVLSIAYDVPLAVLDGNVARVLARVSALRGELRESKNWSALSDISRRVSRHRCARRLESGAHGVRRGRLHAEKSFVPCVPGRPSLPRLRSRHHRRNPGATPQARHSSSENRGGGAT